MHQSRQQHSDEEKSDDASLREHAHIDMHSVLSDCSIEQEDTIEDQSK